MKAVWRVGTIAIVGALSSCVLSSCAWNPASDLAAGLTQTEGTVEQVFGDEVTGATRVGFFPHENAMELLVDDSYAYAIMFDGNATTLVRQGDDPVPLTLATMPPPSVESAWSNVLLGLDDTYVFFGWHEDSVFKSVYRVRKDGRAPAERFAALPEHFPDEQQRFALSGQTLFVDIGDYHIDRADGAGRLVPWDAGPRGGSLLSPWGEYYSSSSYAIEIAADENSLFGFFYDEDDLDESPVSLIRYDLASAATTMLATGLATPSLFALDEKNIYLLGYRDGQTSATPVSCTIDKSTGKVTPMAVGESRAIAATNGVLYAAQWASVSSTSLVAVNTAGVKTVIATSDVAEVPITDVAVNSKYVWITAGHGIYRAPLLAH